jgi:voltage-gated potassium channel Kch
MSASENRSSISSRLMLSEKARTRILIFSFPTALILGIYGYSHYSFSGESISIMNALYHSAQLFIMHAPHFAAPVPLSLEIARWMAAASTGLVLFNASLHILHHERMGLVLRGIKNHAIICGLGRRGITVAEKLYKSGTKVVAIDKDPEPDVVQRLHNWGIPLITGDAARRQILQQARIEYADRLFTFCHDDTTNFSIASEADNFKTINVKPRKCFIHINDAEFRNALQTNHQNKTDEVNQTYRFIDAYGPEAISLITHGLPLDHDGISPGDTRKVHLIILGFGCMGRTIAVKAAQLGQFANRKRMQISVIDHNATTNQSTLLFHHPFIGEVADFSFYQQEVLSPETRNLIEKWCTEPGILVNIVICFDNSSVTYDTVLNLLPVFNRKNVRVMVRANEPESFGFLLKGEWATRYKDLRISPFGTEKGFETLISPENDEAEKFAVDIHKAYVELTNEKNNSKLNTSGEKEKTELPEELKPWDALSEDFRESNRQQAVHMYFKLRACGFEIAGLNDPRPAITEFEKGLSGALAVMEHDRWVAERKVNNWRFGISTDKPNRINRNLISWDKLEDYVRKYNYDTVYLIPELLKKIGKKMVNKSQDERELPV